MSIEKKSNGRYLARWRDPAGKQRARSFDRKLDADRFLATVTVDQMQGRYIDPAAGRVTVEHTLATGRAGSRGASPVAPASTTCSPHRSCRRSASHRSAP